MTTADNNAIKRVIAFVTRTEVLLFLALWLTYGMLINAKNTLNFGQPAIEAIVDQHRFSVEGLPNWIQGEGFDYAEHFYTNKQPGQAMIGSVVYAHLKLLGFSYAGDKLFTGALVVFFSASLLAAFAGVIVFRLARGLSGGDSTLWPLAAALVFGLGTTAFAYSGIGHHDTIATAFLITAFYLIFLIRNDPRADRDRFRALAAGLLLGLTLTTSMLLFFMVIVVGLYFLSLWRWRLFVPLMIGGVVALLPLLIYDAVNFGDPFLLPAIANYKFTGYDPEVFFSYDWDHFLGMIGVYVGLVNLYTPALWCGLIGLFFISFKRRREVLTIVSAIAVLVFYITNVEGIGTSAYGPRYMLPIMSFASLGIVGFRRVPTAGLRLLAGSVLFYIAVKSAVINLVGAMGGAMYCNMGVSGNGYSEYISRMKNGQMPELLLLPWLLPFAAAVLALIILKPFIAEAFRRTAHSKVDSISPDATRRGWAARTGEPKGGVCFKCGANQVRYVPEVTGESSITAADAAGLDRYVCAECGFVELYVRDTSILTEIAEQDVKKY